MLRHGVDGLFLTGSYGAGPLMSIEERVSIFRLAREVADASGSKVLIPHVGAIDARNAVELARAAEGCGANAIGAVPPFYYKHTDAAIIAYYKAIIEAVKIPVFAYNNPETTRYTFTPDVIYKLQALGLKGLKDSPLNLGFLTTVAYDAQVNGKDFQVIPGTSTGWLPLYAMGCRAVIAGMNNYAPEIITELMRATSAGENARAAQAYLVMMEVSKAMHFTDSTVASHMALAARGFEPGCVREPMQLPPRNAPKVAELRTMLEVAFRKLNLPLETGKA
jgi:dihydrodipicolinate synthase/N-acetylneuraminate lyase